MEKPRKADWQLYSYRKRLRRIGVSAVLGLALAGISIISLASGAHAIPLGGSTSISTIAGVPMTSGDGPAGPATSTEFNSPEGVAVSSTGVVYVADTNNDIVWKVSRGTASVYAGTPGVAGDSGDGSLATGATLDSPTGLALDSSGDLFIVDSSDCAVREVSASTGDISTVLGTGTCGSSVPVLPASGTSVELNDNGQQGIFVDSSDNLYVASYSSGHSCVVLKEPISTLEVTKFAGTYGTACGLAGIGGPASSATISLITSISGDSNGNIYMGDPLNCVVWKVSASTGDISDFAGLGNSTCGDSGDGGLASQAELGQVSGLAVDGASDVFISVYDSCEVREVFASGYISTVVGTSSPLCGYGGDGGPPSNAQLDYPTQLAVNAKGYIFIADTGNDIIREVSIGSPTISGITPNSGFTGGGTSVTFTGTNFYGVSAVNFGSVSSTSFQVLSLTRLVAISPPNSSGTQPTEVVTLSGFSLANSSDDFTYNVSSSTQQTNTSLSVVPNPAAVGESVALTATVTSGGQQIGVGTVTFSLGSNSVGSAQVSAQGTATFSLTNLAAGTYSVGANYSGYGTYGSSSALAIDLVVEQGSGSPTTTQPGSPTTTSPTTTQPGSPTTTQPGSPTTTSPPTTAPPQVSATSYYEVASDGGLFSFGDAQFYGSMGAKPLDAPIVSMATTPDGKGYYEVASDGGIFSFGDAQFYGSMGGKPLVAPIVSMAVTPDGKGYYEVASDGGIFSFGDAQFYGSMGGKPLVAPIVSMAVTLTPGGQGYWEVASDGGIFSFGDANFFGSMGGKPLDKPVVGIADF